MPTPLEQMLTLLQQNLNKSKKTVGNQPGPLPEPAKSFVAADLSGAHQNISDALTEINYAGTADTNNLPSTLPGIAAECVDLSSAALAESQRTNPDEQAIGDNIKTVDRIIIVTNGYRDRAGIT